MQELLLESYKFGATRGKRNAAVVAKRKNNAVAVAEWGNKKSKKAKKEKDDDEDDSKPEKPKRKSGITKPVVLSPALAEFMEAESLPRTEIVKKLHAYIKTNNLQDPKNKRNILFDQKLQDVFKTKKTDYFKLNRYQIWICTVLHFFRLISKHVHHAGEV